jgi:hypothetical protein
MILTEKFLTPRSTSVLRKVVDWMHAGYPLNRSINVMEAETGESLIDCRDTILDLYTREKKVRDEAQATALAPAPVDPVKPEEEGAEKV